MLAVRSNTAAILSATALALVLAATATTRTDTVFSALPAQPAAPADNPTTPEKVALGRLLFWDPILSATSDVACATCHHPSFGYADGLDISVGVNGVGIGAARHFVPGQPARLVKRNSPTVLNAAFNGLTSTGVEGPSTAPMFWDSRVASLEAQALEPIKSLEEMRGDIGESQAAIDQAAARVAAIPEYRQLFAKAFGPSATVNGTTIAQAIAAFERTLVTANSPFDRYMRGDSSAMTDEQVRGMARFQTMGCANCHSGPMFSDFTAHVLGVPENSKLAAADSGVNSRFAFRTPTLRNLALTAPYMHNGTLASLDDVINFYNQVGGGRGGRGRGGPGGPGGGPGGPGFAPGGQGGPGGAPSAVGGPAVTPAAPPNPGRGGGGGGRGGGRFGTRNPNVPRQDLDPLLRQVNVRGGRQEVLAFLDALNDRDFDRSVPSTVPSGLEPGGRTK